MTRRTPKPRPSRRPTVAARSPLSRYGSHEGGSDTADDKAQREDSDSRERLTQTGTALENVGEGYD